MPARSRAWRVSAGRFKAIDQLHRDARFEVLDDNDALLDARAAEHASGGEDENVADDRLPLISRAVDRHTVNSMETAIHDHRQSDHRLGSRCHAARRAVYGQGGLPRAVAEGLRAAAEQGWRIRCQGGKRTLLDGPLADTEDQPTGF